MMVRPSTPCSLIAICYQWGTRVHKLQYLTFTPSVEELKKVLTASNLIFFLGKKMLCLEELASNSRLIFFVFTPATIFASMESLEP